MLIVGMTKIVLKKKYVVYFIVPRRPKFIKYWQDYRYAIIGQQIMMNF